jgi:hypothetical protein
MEEIAGSIQTLRFRFNGLAFAARVAVEASARKLSPVSDARQRFFFNELFWRS